MKKSKTTRSGARSAKGTAKRRKVADLTLREKQLDRIVGGAVPRRTIG